MADATVQEIDRLVGAATPHFAYQLCARILELIEDLPPDHPTRTYGEEKRALLVRLGHASSKAPRCMSALACWNSASATPVADGACAAAGAGSRVQDAKEATAIARRQLRQLIVRRPVMVDGGAL